jgi:asparaginyl-tRNA synthetase
MQTIKNILVDDFLEGSTITIRGWVRYFRNDRFIVINDGSTTLNLQCVIEPTEVDAEVRARFTTGASLECTGEIVASKGSGQRVEMKVEKVSVIGDSDPLAYPMQPKKHSLEFMRDNAHLRMRTSLYGAIFRIRHHVTFSIHEFFHNKGFINIHTPIITVSDAEGAGEMFRVTTLSPECPPMTEGGNVDWKQDFFGTKSHLTVSGQLQGELAATALGKVYTFGPTFRAENSNTSRHLAEFWMVEPEVAFMDIWDIHDLAEKLCRHIIESVIRDCPHDIQVLDDHLKEEDTRKPKEQRRELTLMGTLLNTIKAFASITYTDAIDILLKSKPHQKKQFKFPVEWGMDLQSEHERYLVDKHFKCPVIITGYPAKIKAFYMRTNGPDDHGYTDKGPTVAAMDILFPGVGEVIGGSQREERLDVLGARMDEMGVSQDELKWYLDTRRFGTVPHSGFGLGLERMMLFITGMSNVRDIIPFPRTPNNAQF